MDGIHILNQADVSVVVRAENNAFGLSVHMGNSIVDTEGNVYIDSKASIPSPTHSSITLFNANFDLIKVSTMTLDFGSGGTGVYISSSSSGFKYDKDLFTVVKNPGIDIYTYKVIFSGDYEIPASKVGISISPLGVLGGVLSGIPPYTFNATGLPAGLSISTTGVISGTPTTAGVAGTGTVTVTAGNGETASIEIPYGTIASAGGGG